MQTLDLNILGVTSLLWTSVGGAILATAIVAACACSSIGTLLVLRRMSLLGDALSHAVLPGVAAAFILSDSYGIGPLLVGALVAGLATAALTQALERYARIPGDASLGVVFTSLFAIGVVLIHYGIQGVHFDLQCVYEGSLEFTPLDAVPLAGINVPRDLLLAAAALTVNLAILTLLWKELVLSSFDPALAETLGFRSGLLHYLVTGLTAVTAVATFKAVGSILVVAMLIIPPATARLLTQRAAPMLGLSLIVSAMAALGGYVIGVQADVNIAGMTAVTAMGLFVVAMLFAPEEGLVARWIDRSQTSLRVAREDLLGMLYRWEEASTAHDLRAAEAVAAAGGGWQARHALRQLAAGNRIRITEQAVALTSVGRAEAAATVRSHRLWETYLVERLGLPRDHVHEPAHRMEHFLDEKMRSEIAKAVSAAPRDPHGRNIPGEPPNSVNQ